MKTLVLTPSNPVAISEAAILTRLFENEETMVISPQFLGLLQHMSFGKPYVPCYFALMKALEKNPYKDKKERKNIIYYGNIYKNTKIKFDNIIKFDCLDDVYFDLYLREGCKIFNIDINEFYLPEDANIEVPSMKKLILLLEQFYKKNETEEKEDEI